MICDCNLSLQGWRSWVDDVSARCYRSQRKKHTSLEKMLTIKFIHRQIQPQQTRDHRPQTTHLSHTTQNLKRRPSMTLLKSKLDRGPGRSPIISGSVSSRHARSLPEATLTGTGDDRLFPLNTGLQRKEEKGSERMLSDRSMLIGSNPRGNWSMNGGRVACHCIITGPSQTRCRVPLGIPGNILQSYTTRPPAYRGLALEG